MASSASIPQLGQLPARSNTGYQASSSMPSTIDILMREASSGRRMSAKDLADLKRAILTEGIEQDEAGMSHHRVYVWLILLETSLMPYDTYHAYVERGPSPAHHKIKNDTFRTMATDPLFQRRVSVNSLSRLLNAAAWALHDALPSSRSSKTAMSMSLDGAEGMDLLPPLPPSPSPIGNDTANVDSPLQLPASQLTASQLPAAQLPPLAGPEDQGIYVQGVNVLAAPLLYVARSEAQALTLLLALLRGQLPSYTRGAMLGVHAGLRLVDACLGVLDPPLAAHLAAHGLGANIYAFAPLLTLSACTPPLPEVLLLWDFLLAYGVHLNVLAVVAQVWLMRDEILAERTSPGRVLRTLRPLQARRIIELVVLFVGKLEPGLYREVVEHTA